MLNNLTFSSYKRFAGTESIKISPVTVLVGKNSSGKSSIMKLLPLIENAMSGELRKSAIRFDNNGVSVGASFRDLVHDGNAMGLSFSLEFQTGLSIDVSLMTLDPQGKDVVIKDFSTSYNGQKYSVKLIKDSSKIYYLNTEIGEILPPESFCGFFNRDILARIGYPIDNFKNEINVDYIGPLRQFPSRGYSYSGDESTEKVGVDGGKAYNWLYASEELLHGVSDWFERNFDGTQLSVKTLEGAMYQFILTKNGKNFYSNIVDVGTGISQVLPIVARCLQPQENTIVVIEQPELHLHPAAHRLLASLFAHSAKKYGLRFIVETHSENIILGLREAVVDSENPLEAEDVAIYTIEDDSEYEATLTEIEISPDGFLSYWPEGVFNESYEILTEIKRKAEANRAR